MLGHPTILREEAIDTDRTTLMAAVAAAEQPLKLGDRSTVVRTNLELGRPIVVKHYHADRRFDPRDAIGCSKAIRSLRAAERLLALGLPSARPLAAWSEPGKGSYLVLEDLAPRVPLQRAILEVHGEDRREMLRATAAMLRACHERGAWLRDAKPSNLLADPSQPTEAPVLIDHDRNRFLPFALPFRWRRRDLAALHAGIPAEINASARFDFLRAYDARWLDRKVWRRHVRPLLAEATARGRLWIPRSLLSGRSP